MFEKKRRFVQLMIPLMIHIYLVPEIRLIEKIIENIKILNFAKSRSTEILITYL